MLGTIGVIQTATFMLQQREDAKVDLAKSDERVELEHRGARHVGTSCNEGLLP